MTTSIQIEIAYANETVQKIIPLSLPQGSTVSQAILASELFILFPELKSEEDAAPFFKIQDCVGIFSEKVALDKILQEGDRIEIYRTLKINPKEARSLRAKNERKKAKQSVQLKNIEKKKLRKKKIEGS
jgi:putative ubiquitin-RnfH superfamily antitoxin RatB of RatAB toxin-antitoxin module